MLVQQYVALLQRPDRHWLFCVQAEPGAEPEDASCVLPVSRGAESGVASLFKPVSGDAESFVIEPPSVVPPPAWGEEDEHAGASARMANATSDAQRVIVQ